MAIHLTIGAVKPALDWSRYRDANPVPTSPLATAPSGPVRKTVGSRLFIVHTCSTGIPALIALWLRYWPWTGRFWVHISVPTPTQSRFLKGPVGRCTVTTLSFHSLTTNTETKPTNSMSLTDSWGVCPGQCAWTLSSYKHKQENVNNSTGMKNIVKNNYIYKLKHIYKLKNNKN